MSTLFDTDNQHAGFRLNYLEVYNWGTFHQRLYRLEPQGRTSLLTGANGSGKTTMADALLTLLVPPSKRHYNQSSGADRKRERDETSYMLGAFGLIRDDDSLARTQYLRTKDDISVLLACFSNASFQQEVTLAQVRWWSSGQLKRLYIVCPQALEAQRDLLPFTPGAEWRKQLGLRYPVKLSETFPLYQQAFTHLLGLRSDRALSLFAQTVGVKVLGNLTDFLRDHMLEVPQLDEAFARLKANYDDLLGSHRQMEKAQEQVRLLSPLRDKALVYDGARRRVSALEAAQNALGPLAARGRLASLETELDKERREKILKEARRLQVDTELDQARRRERELEGGPGGLKELWRQWEAEAAALQQRLTEKKRRWEGYKALCREAGFEPVRTPEDWADQHARALDQLVRDEAASRAWEQRWADYWARQQAHEAALSDLDEAAAALARGQGLLPPAWRAAAEAHGARLGRPALLACQVARVKDPVWRPAVEALLADLGPAALAEDLSALLSPLAGGPGNDPTHSESGPGAEGTPGTALAARGTPGARETAQNAGEGPSAGAGVPAGTGAPANTGTAPGVYGPSGAAGPGGTPVLGTPAPDLAAGLLDADRPEAAALALDTARRVASVLEFRRHGPGTEALEAHIGARFDHLLAADWDEFWHADRALLPNGWVKTGSLVRRLPLDAPAWGWDAAEAAGTLAARRAALDLNGRQLADEAQRLTNDRERRAAARRAWEGLKAQTAPDWDYWTEEAALQALEGRRTNLAEGEAGAWDQERAGLKRLIKDLDKERESLIGRLAWLEGTLADKGAQRDKQAELCQRWAAVDSAEAWQALEALEPNAGPPADGDWAVWLEAWTERLGRQRREADSALRDLERGLEADMVRFLRPPLELQQRFPEWSGDTADWEARLEDLPRYLALLERIETEDLPAHQRRFKEWLNRRLIEDVADFKTTLEGAYQEVLDAVGELNKALRGITYSHLPPTYIELAAEDSRDPEVREFRQLLKTCLPSAREGDLELVFERIRALITQLAERPDWRARVLDVRQWLSFGVWERYAADDAQKQFYQDSQSLSGGEKAKLAYTILASALAYQFGIQRETISSHSFRFVVVDEAFSKVDPENSRFAMNLFRQLDLQLMVVTPLDRINLVEPYIHTIHYVEHRPQRGSSVYDLSVGEYQRLKKRS